MSRRIQLEHEVSVAQERIKKAAKDTPKNILKLWEQELVDLELERLSCNSWGIKFSQFPSCIYLC